METLLLAREIVVRFFKQYETFIIPVLKFFLGVFIFSRLQSIGYVNAELLPFLGASLSLPALMMLGVSFALLPYTLSYAVIIVYAAAQYSANLEIAAVVFLFLLCILLFYARMAVKESIWIIFTVVAFYFNVPYLIPLTAGMYGSLTVIIPVTLGVFINSYIPVIQNLTVTTPTAGLNLTEMPGTFSDVYTSLVNSLSATQGWVFYAFVFAMVIIVVHVMSRMSIDFSKEIAIVVGCVLNIIGFILAVLLTRANIGIVGVVFGSLVCGCIAEVMRFFDAVLDYQRAESVQFEDETHYYYVRVVPKIVLTKRKRVVRRIRPRPEDEE